MKKIFEDEIFTSKLSIYGDHSNSVLENDFIPLMIERVRQYSSFEPSIITGLNDSKKSFEDKIQYFKEFVINEKHLLKALDFEGISLDNLIKIATYSGKTLDITSILKGYAIQMLANFLGVSQNSFLINFGGDIYAQDVENIEITYGPKNRLMKRNLSGMFCFFSSGNYDENRGEHIIQNNNYILGASLYCSRFLPIKCDMYCTQLVADDEFRIWNEEFNYFEVTKFLRNGLVC